MKQFIIVPNSGIQILRRLPIEFSNSIKQSAILAKELMIKTSLSLKDRLDENPLTPLLSKFISSDNIAPQDELTGWRSYDNSLPVFYRLYRIGSEIYVDIVIDSNCPELSVNNTIPLQIQSGIKYLNSKSLDIASVYIDHQSKPQNIYGTLIMDFGNTGSTFIFSKDGQQATEARPIQIHNPFSGPIDTQNPLSNDTILKSTSFLLYVPSHIYSEPWFAIGGHADNFIALEDPSITSIYAPKKFVRDWTKSENIFGNNIQEPTSSYQGVIGRQQGLHPIINYVKHILKQILSLTISSQINPNFSTLSPKLYPQYKEILLTYPLTWRKEEKNLFKGLIDEAAQQMLMLDDRTRARFNVELVCSEPVAVIVYALWDVFFQFYPLGESPGQLLDEQNNLVSSFLGNTTGKKELRILVIDIGGGSTDISLVEAKWSLNQTTSEVDVSLRELDSLRYNRAGDRISHILATLILEYLRNKYGFKESLVFDDAPNNLALTRQIKRGLVSWIIEQVEDAKTSLSTTKIWMLNDVKEQIIKNMLLGFSTDPIDLQEGITLDINLDDLEKCVVKDIANNRTGGEPGFMDIFLDLQAFEKTLRLRDENPHLVLLSGRTSRLPFIKKLACKHLNMPSHRVRYIRDLIPDVLHSSDYENIDKLAVVLGAHRFRFGSPIRFQLIKEDSRFHRFIGVVNQTPKGLYINRRRVLAEPNELAPKVSTLNIGPNQVLMIGHSFAVDNRSEIIATLSNLSSTDQVVELYLTDDFSIQFHKGKPEGLDLHNHVPGGNSSIVDNFYDTGSIDQEPAGFLANIVNQVIRR